jgi:hypothetical protein
MKQLEAPQKLNSLDRPISDEQRERDAADQ